jgi:hypothetical protein
MLEQQEDNGIKVSNGYEFDGRHEKRDHPLTEDFSSKLGQARMPPVFEYRLNGGEMGQTVRLECHNRDSFTMTESSNSSTPQVSREGSRANEFEHKTKRIEHAAQTSVPVTHKNGAQSITSQKIYKQPLVTQESASKTSKLSSLSFCSPDRTVASTYSRTFQKRRETWKLRESSTSQLKINNREYDRPRNAPVLRKAARRHHPSTTASHKDGVEMSKMPPTNLDFTNNFRSPQRQEQVMAHSPRLPSYEEATKRISCSVVPSKETIKSNLKSVKKARPTSNSDTQTYLENSRQIVQPEPRLTSWKSNVSITSTFFTKTDYVKFDVPVIVKGNVQQRVRRYERRSAPQRRRTLGGYGEDIQRALVGHQQSPKSKDTQTLATRHQNHVHDNKQNANNEQPIIVHQQTSTAIDTQSPWQVHPNYIGNSKDQGITGVIPVQNRGWAQERASKRLIRQFKSMSIAVDEPAGSSLMGANGAAYNATPSPKMIVQPSRPISSPFAATTSTAEPEIFCSVRQLSGIYNRRQFDTKK